MALRSDVLSFCYSHVPFSSLRPRAKYNCLSSVRTRYPAPGRDPKRRSHKATKAQRRTRETPSCLPAFVTPCESQFFSCRSSRSIRRPRRSFSSHQSSITNHQCQGPAFGRNQERSPLCRVPAERGATRGNPPPVPPIPHHAPNALLHLIPRLCPRTPHGPIRR
jgi:hypothetical protein